MPDSLSPPGSETADLLEGRDALRRHAWPAAYDLLDRADQEGALDCAISIQRALAEHRRSSGFALSVRIGLHTAQASRRGSDYRGVGVHTAARVADLAGAGEILATTETSAEAGLAASGSREAAVKGVTTPVTVSLVDWSAARGSKAAR